MSAKFAGRVLFALNVALQYSSVALAEPQLSGGSNSSFSTPPVAGNLTKPANSTNGTTTRKPSATPNLAKIRKDQQNFRNWQVVRGFLYGWLGLFLLFLLSLLALVFRRYIRTVTSLAPGNTQAYFAPVNRHWGLLKKHFVFAPLFHKRHHRPLMITRTIDNGCIPSRPQVSILVVYFVLLMSFTFWRIDYSMPKYDVMLSINRRSGLMALSQLLPLFLLAARNNPLIWWTGISFDAYNLFHRWLGRFVVVEMGIHGLTYIMRKVEKEGWRAYAKVIKGKSWTVRSGTIAIGCAVIILIQTPAPIRHKFYETFLHLHQLLVAVFVWAIWLHMEGYYRHRQLVYGIIAIWSIERAFRLFRLIYRNVGSPMTSAEIEVMSPIAMRVKVRMTRPWTFTPGQHAYVYMPFVGLWTAHPFSVAWTDEDIIEENLSSDKDSLPRSIEDIAFARKRNIYFLIRKMRGFTNSLYEKTKKNGGKLKTLAFIEGPYNQQTLHSYGTVVLVAAGIGITHIVPHVHDLVRGYGNGTVAARRVLLIWCVRDLTEVELIRDWMAIILALPRRAEVLRIMIYAFQLGESKLDIADSTIQVFPGIAKFGPIFDEEVKNSVGSIGVSVCGIGAVADEVRFACRKWMDKVNIEFMEESFSW